jgi:hypothetical protein
MPGTRQGMTSLARTPYPIGCISSQTLRGGEWQRETEYRASLGKVLCPDPPPMGLDDCARDGKTHFQALLLDREEGVENLIELDSEQIPQRPFGRTAVNVVDVRCGSRRRGDRIGTFAIGAADV